MAKANFEKKPAKVAPKKSAPKAKAKDKGFTADSTIGEVIKNNPRAQDVLMGFGMHCFGCPMSQMETLGEAAAVHGVDINLMIEKLNEAPAKGEVCGCGCGHAGCGTEEKELDDACDCEDDACDCGCCVEDGVEVVYCDDDLCDCGCEDDEEGCDCGCEEDPCDCGDGECDTHHGVGSKH